MAGAGLRPWTRLLRCLWLRWSMCAVGGPLLIAGCSTTPIAQIAAPSAAETRSAWSYPYQPPASTRQDSALQQAAYHARPEPTEPTSQPIQPEVKAEAARPIPIDLDAVMQLTEKNNAQITLARVRVEEAILDYELVCASCMLPSKKIARQIEADVKIWQRKAELSKTTSEVLQEAASAYFDLLTARRAHIITKEMAQRAEPMLKRAEDLQKNDPSTTVLYEAVRAEIIGRDQALAKLKEQGDAVTAKLAYLLNVPCDVILATIDPTLLPVNLVDVALPTCKLVEQALDTGPAIQETRGMLAALQAGQARASGRLCLATHKRQIQQALADNRELQIHLTLQELAGKLTAGVLEARDAILLGREQQTLGQQQIQHTEESYRLSELRVRENAPNARINDVLQAIRALEQAHHENLTALSAHNKAQVRLLLLLGAPSAKPGQLPLPGPPMAQ